MSTGRPPLPCPRSAGAELTRRPIIEHDLKVWPEFFVALEAGSKSFEVRRDDRPESYRVGDTLLFREWDPVRGLYTGRSIRRQVGYLAPLGGIGCPGFVGMSLVPIGPDSSGGGA